MELVRNRRRRFADAAGFGATLALILWHWGNKKPRRIHQMPKTGASCSRPFSDLFNVAASRSAQMTTREDLRLASAKSSIIAVRPATKGGVRNKRESFGRWIASILPPSWVADRDRLRNHGGGESPSLNRQRLRTTIPTNQN